MKTFHYLSCCFGFQKAKTCMETLNCRKNVLKMLLIFRTGNSFSLMLDQSFIIAVSHLWLSHAKSGHWEEERTSIPHFRSVQCSEPWFDILGILARFPHCDLQKYCIQWKQRLVIYSCSNTTRYLWCVK